MEQLVQLFCYVTLAFFDVIHHLSSIVERLFLHFIYLVVGGRFKKAGNSIYINILKQRVNNRLAFI